MYLTVDLHVNNVSAQRGQKRPPTELKLKTFVNRFLGAGTQTEIFSKATSALNI